MENNKCAIWYIVDKAFSTTFDETSLKSIWIPKILLQTRIVYNKFIKIQINFLPRVSLINSTPKRYKTNIRFIIVRSWRRRDIEKKVKKPKLWIILNRHTETHGNRWHDVVPSGNNKFIIANYRFLYTKRRLALEIVAPALFYDSSISAAAL